jgi:predicted nucleic acid-binding protein
MMFWDSSAIFPLLLEEMGSSNVTGLYQDDPEQTVWCLTEVELTSALARRIREGMLPIDLVRARERLRMLTARWQEVAALENVRGRALRLLGIHSLHAADALQLAAALVFCDERTESLPFVCLDDRLAEAARRERFPVFP